jgi:3-phosphoshikimate 1-carboxyvinyltransferase
MTGPAGLTELTVEGPAPLRGRLRLPGDKGISHRALLFAALATGTSRLAGLADGDDVARTLAVLEALGVGIAAEGGAAVAVHGAGVEALREPDVVLDCANSGTTLRMSAGLLAGRPIHAVLTGDAALNRRPMGRVVDPLRAMGARIDGRDDARLAPLAIRGGALVGTRHELEVPSGQVKTALCLAGLQAAGTTEIVEPAPSRDHSERMLEALGAPIERRTPTTVAVRAGVPAPFELVVPGDPSSAAFFAVAAVVTPGSELVLEDVALNPTRIGFVDVLTRMGADLEVAPRGARLGEPVGDLMVRSGPLAGTVVDADEGLIDEIPVLAVAAAFANGVTEFRDVAELRVKESDRLATLEVELTRLGVGVEVGADRLVVRGGQPRPARLDSHGDHRIAMAAAVAANAVSGTSTVGGWRAVGASYPRFDADLAAVTGRAR